MALPSPLTLYEKKLDFRITERFLARCSDGGAIGFFVLAHAIFSRNVNGNGRQKLLMFM